MLARPVEEDRDLPDGAADAIDLRNHAAFAGPEPQAIGCPLGRRLDVNRRAAVVAGPRGHRRTEAHRHGRVEIRLVRLEDVLRGQHRFAKPREFRARKRIFLNPRRPAAGRTAARRNEEARRQRLLRLRTAERHPLSHRIAHLTCLIGRADDAVAVRTGEAHGAAVGAVRAVAAARNRNACRRRTRRDERGPRDDPRLIGAERSELVVAAGVERAIGGSNRGCCCRRPLRAWPSQCRAGSPSGAMTC